MELYRQPQFQNEKFFTIALSVDNVIFGFENGNLLVLLIKRGEEPFNNYWALPGAKVKPDEELVDAPMRILKELTGLSNVYLEQCKTFGKVDRHPEGRVVTVAYFSLINAKHVKLTPSSFAVSTAWVPVKDIVDLAFDHKEILEYCHNSLKESVKQRPVGFELLPQTFTLSDLQTLYEAILEVKLDKRNFRKKMLSMDILLDVNQRQSGVAHRPAKMYKFDEYKYEQLKKKGVAFAI